ncbi:MAG: hypothetical protein HKN32_01400, partial [Flavobacteriales bacterium]|nr:hypothetical protein [Flavobacteriales bacterium]
GMKYFTIPFGLADSYTYRVLAREDGTSVTIDGSASFALNAGEFIEFNNEALTHCIQATKPVATIQFMEGVNCAGNGDPAMLILNSEDQKIDQITFSTVESTVITDHFLTVIAETSGVDNITFNGSLLDPATFNVVPSCNDHSYTIMPVAAGSHSLASPNGVTAYVYGNGNAESYAYAAGSFQGQDPIELQVDSVICAGDSVVLNTLQPLFNVEWYAQSDPATILGTESSITLYPPYTTDVIIASGDLLVSGCPGEDQFLVESPDPPQVDLLVENAEICKFESIQLGVSPSDGVSILEYSWSPIVGLDDPTSANPIATPLSSTVYTVDISTPTGCGSNTAQVTIDVVGGSTTGVTAAAEPELVCSGEEVQLSAQAGAVVFEDNFDPGVSWGLWCEVLNGIQSDVCGSVNGNTLFFNGNGVRSATTNSLDMTQGEVISFALKIGSGVAPCDDAEPGDDVVVEYSTDGCDGPFTTMATLNESSYAEFTTVTLPIPADAQSPSTHFRIRQLNNSGADQDTWAIDDFYVSSTDVTGYSYQWSPENSTSNSTDPNPIGTPTNDQWFHISLTENSSGCTYEDSIFVDVGGYFELTTTPDTTLCDSQGITLDSEPSTPGSYSWLWSSTNGSFDDVTAPSPIFTSSQSSLVSVEVENDFGCTVSADIDIVVNELIDLNIIASSSQICQGETVQLEADIDGSNANLEFAWSPASVLSSTDQQTTEA